MTPLQFEAAHAAAWSELEAALGPAPKGRRATAADLLPSFYALGALAMLWRHDFKRIGDLAAGTLVVHVERAGARAAAPPPAPARAPAVPLPAAAQAAIVAWAGRVPGLTPARADELAQIAVPAVVPRAMHGDRVAALVGVAHWLLGRR